MQFFKEYNLEEKLAYLNGYLTNLAILNSGTNYQCDYLFSAIENKNSVKETIQHEFKPFFEWLLKNRKIENRTNLKVHYQEITNLDDTLNHEFEQWLFNKEFPIQPHDTYQKKIILEQLTQMFSNILEDDIQMWQVLDGSYDIEYFDLIIKDQKNYYYLHLGWCD